MKNFKTLSRMLPLLIAGSLFSTNLFSANLYWIGNGGNWDDPSHWSSTSGGTSCGCIPSANDSVYFDAASFINPNQQVNVNALAYCSNMNWTGANSPILAGTSDIHINGSLTLISGMNISSYTGALYFESIASGQTITSAGKQFVNPTNHIYFENGQYILQDAFSTGGYVYLNKGQLDFNNKNVALYYFESYTSNVRSLVLGNSAVTITGYMGWNCSPTNFSLSTGSSVITFTYAGQVSFAGGSQTYNNLVFTNGSANTANINDGSNGFNNVTFNAMGYIGGNNNTFNKVSFAGDGIVYGSGHTFSKLTFLEDGTVSGGNNAADSVLFTAGRSYILGSGSTFAINSSLQATGNCSNWVDIRSSTAGTQATISSATGTMTVSYVRIKDIKAEGGATFTDNNAWDFGNNTGWTMNTIAPKDLYWIGNGGDWDNAAHWSLTSGGASSGCIPTIYDNVFFDANSFTTFSAQVNINVPAYCKNMDWTGAVQTPKIAGASDIHINGSLTLISGMNISSYMGGLYFESLSSGQTITSAGKAFANPTNHIYFENGQYILQDAFNTAGYLYLNKGQLDFNSKNVTLYYFESYNSNVRSLVLGNSAVTITGYNGWNCSPTNFSVSTGSSVITFTYAGQVSFAGGSQPYNNLVFTNGSANTANINDGNNVFNNVTFNAMGYIGGNNNTFNKVSFAGDGIVNGTGHTFSKLTFLEDGTVSGGNNAADSVLFTAGRSYILGSGSTFAINSSLQATGNCSNWVDIRSSTAGTQATISSATGTMTVSYVRIKDIKAEGGATFTDNNAWDFGNNTGWTMNTIAPKDLYWIGNGGDWDNAAHWSLTSGGASSGCIPTIYDNVFFDANSFTTFSAQVNINVPAYCKNMDWTGAVQTPKIAGASDIHINGSLTLISGMNISSYMGGLYFESLSSGQTITSAGKAFANPTNHIYFENGQYILQDAFNTAGYLYLNKGQLDFNSKNVTLYYFESYNSNVRSLVLGNSAVTITGYNGWNCSPTNFSVSTGSSVITFTYAGQVSFAGGSQPYNNLVFTNGSANTANINDGNNVFNNVTFNAMGYIGGNNNTFNKVSFAGDGIVNGTGHTFSKLTFLEDGTVSGGNNAADSVLFTAGKSYILGNTNTFTVNKYFGAMGTAALYITIQSNSPGTPAIIKKTNGGVCAEYLNLQDISATGGVSFRAGNSIDLGNNNGWIFLGCSSIPPTVSVPSHTNLNCNGVNNGSAAATTTGGTSPYTYLWSPISASTSAVSGLAAGIYTVTVIDGNSLTSTSTVSITQPTAITASVISTNATPCGTATGTASAINVSGGTSPYTYQWTNGDKTLLADTLSAGFYVVTIADASGCTKTEIATINDVGAQTISINSITNVSCHGENNGAINISVTGGTAPYIYAWVNGATTQNVSNLSAGPYEIEVTDANGCKSTKSILVTEPTAISLSMSTTSASCGSADGTATATATGGTGSYTYSWNTAPVQTTSTATGLASGSYSVMVADNNGCTTTTQATVVNFGAPTVTLDSIVPAGCSSGTGSIYITVTGGAPPYTYLWSNSDANQDLVGVLPGNYGVTIYSGNSCTGAFSAVIPSLLPASPAICIVTVDTATGKNICAFEKDIAANPGISHYNFYRESTQAGVFQLLGSKDADSLSIWTDQSANPMQRAWRYKITAVDTCGNESPLSNFHKTLHLSSNLGLAGNVNLQWDSYEGFSFLTYNIWRYTSATGWDSLDAVPSTNHSYNDMTPPTLTNLFYYIEVSNPNGCFVSSKNPEPMGSNLDFSKSNINKINPTLTGVQPFYDVASSIQVYPNPTIGKFILQFSTFNGKVDVLDIMGRKVLSENLEKGTLNLDLTDEPDGIYFLQIQSKEGVMTKKIVVSK